MIKILVAYMWFEISLSKCFAELFLILFDLVFLYFFCVFGGERKIKVEQNYIFNLVFIGSGLWNSN